MKWKTLFKRATYQQVVRDWQAGRRSRTFNRVEFFSGLGETSWLLYGLTRAIQADVCVEIGSARGKAACHIGMALSENGRGRLYAIDPHSRTSWNDPNSVDTFPIMQKNLRDFGVQDWVEIVRSTSQEAARSWTRPIDILFIDGDHTYDGVKRDFELFLPHLRPNSYVLFHDTLWDLHPEHSGSRADMGVPKFVEELRVRHFPVITLMQFPGLTLVQPTPGGFPLSPVAKN